MLMIYFLSPAADGKPVQRWAYDANDPGQQEFIATARAKGWQEFSALPELPVIPPSPEAVQAMFTRQIQKRLDDFAQTRLYDNILSACTYATSTVPKFRAEGQYCVEARDQTWAAAYAILDDVLAGTRPLPDSLADIEADLPALAWPETEGG